MTMSVVVLLVVLFLTGLLTDMPKAVLGGDRLPHRHRPDRHRRAAPGLGRAAAASSSSPSSPAVVGLRRRRRAGHHPRHRAVDHRDRPPPVPARATSSSASPQDGEPTYAQAEPGHAEPPGLIVFRYDADLFYANANQFSDDVQAAHRAARPIRCGGSCWTARSIPDVDYSAGAALKGLVTFVHNRGAIFALAGRTRTCARPCRAWACWTSSARTTSSTPWRTPWPRTARPGEPRAPGEDPGRTRRTIRRRTLPRLGRLRPRRRPRRRGVRELTRPPRCSTPRVLPRRARAGCGRTRAATTPRAAGARSRAPWGSAASPPHAPSPEPGRAVRGRRRG